MTTRSGDQDSFECLEVLSRKEEAFYLASDYLGTMIKSADRNTDESSIATNFSHRWREIMCEWAYNVVDHFQFSRDLVSNSMNLLDRFFDRSLARHAEGMTKPEFQLLAMTCLYIAIKVEHPTKFPLDIISHLSRGCFSQEQFKDAELKVLRELQWNIHPPSPFAYLNCYLRILRPEGDNVKIYNQARYLIESSVMDYDFVGKRSSTIAMSALLNALDEQQSDNNHILDLGSLVDPVEFEVVWQCRARLRMICSFSEEDQHSPLPRETHREVMAASPITVTAFQHY